MGVLTFKGTFQVLAKNLGVTGETESDKWIKRDSSVRCGARVVIDPDM